jgi:hypothetical protein
MILKSCDCDPFAQAQTREEYLAYLAEEAEYDIPWDPAPIGRYNVKISQIFFPRLCLRKTSAHRHLQHNV